MTTYFGAGLFEKNEDWPEDGPRVTYRGVPDFRFSGTGPIAAVNCSMMGHRQFQLDTRIGLIIIYSAADSPEQLATEGLEFLKSIKIS